MLSFYADFPFFSILQIESEKDDTHVSFGDEAVPMDDSEGMFLILRFETCSCDYSLVPQWVGEEGCSR